MDLSQFPAFRPDPSVLDPQSQASMMLRPTMAAAAPVGTPMSIVPDRFGQSTAMADMRTAAGQGNYGYALGAGARALGHSFQNAASAVLPPSLPVLGHAIANSGLWDGLAGNPVGGPAQAVAAAAPSPMNPNVKVMKTQAVPLTQALAGGPQPAAPLPNIPNGVLLDLAKLQSARKVVPLKDQMLKQVYDFHKSAYDTARAANDAKGMASAMDVMKSLASAPSYTAGAMFGNNGNGDGSQRKD